MDAVWLGKWRACDLFSAFPIPCPEGVPVVLNSFYLVEPLEAHSKLVESEFLRDRA